MDLTILKDIAIIFAFATFVNYLFTKIRTPTIIGYLLTGILLGPHLTGIISSAHQIELLAELGIVLLMFSIGLEFSLTQLMKIRKAVLLGGFVQVASTVGIVFVFSRMLSMDWNSALFFGLLIALSSTAIVLKILQERSELTSNYGRSVLGILIFQDIILVPFLIFTPLLGGDIKGVGTEFLFLLFKSIAIITIVYIGNRWIMPKALRMLAHTRNQELFIMSILLICLSAALLTAQLGMSLAFGAFLAGLMISKSEHSHMAFGHILPFKDTFTSFFFVSIGMLLDLEFVYNNIFLVLLSVSAVILIKFLISGGAAFILGHTFKGTVLVGIALCQVGEFSFILSSVGMKYHIISDFYYQLFLSVSVITMSASPFLVQLGKPIAEQLLKLPLPKKVVEGLFPLKQIRIPKLKNHLVIIGKDRRSISLSTMSKYTKLPYISIIFDPTVVKERQEKGEKVIYGDAINRSILEKASTDKAEIVVISISNLITSMAVVREVRKINPHAYILVRTRCVEDIEELYKLGANQVIPEEFETAIDLFERVLTKFLVPKKEIEVKVGEIRNNHYGIFRQKKIRRHSILDEIPNIEIQAVQIQPDSAISGKTLHESQLRKKFELTLVAIKRGGKVIEHPTPDLILKENDIAYLLGKPDKIAIADNLFSSPTDKKEADI